MTNRIPVGLLHSYVNEGSTVLVHSGEVEFTDFVSCKAIGAYMVMGGTAVSIVSPSGCVLAQIPERPPTTPQGPFSAEQNVRRMMEDVEVFYRTFRTKLAGAKVYIAYGKAQATVTMPEQVRIMMGLFRNMGLEPQVFSYESPPAVGRAAVGTFLVVRPREQDGPASVYLEDDQLD